MGIAVSLAILLGLAITFIQAKETDPSYVRGEYGSHCYPANEYHGNIKFLLKFETLEECLKSFYE